MLHEFVLVFECCNAQEKLCIYRCSFILFVLLIFIEILLLE